MTVTRIDRIRGLHHDSRWSGCTAALTDPRSCIRTEAETEKKKKKKTFPTSSTLRQLLVTRLRKIIRAVNILLRETYSCWFKTAAAAKTQASLVAN